MKSGAPKLTITINVDIAPDPRKYTNLGQEMPSEREIMVKEQLLERKYVINNLNIQKCNMPGVSYGEGCYYEAKQLFMQEMQRKK